MAPLELERQWRGQRRRQRQQWQRKDRKVEAVAARSIHDLPDDLLRQLLLRLDSPSWLIRAACACKRWRGVVISDVDSGDEGRAFLRLARSLHPPTVVGHYHSYSGGGYRFVPIDGAGSRHIFSLNDFHDSYSSVADCHGGLVLLRMRYGPCELVVPNLLVRDPLTRKHRWVSSRPRLPNEQNDCCYGTKDTFFLLDGDDGNISISNFRVLYRLNAGGGAATDPKAAVFSTANGGEWDWLFSIDDINTTAMRVLPEQTRNIFNYTLPWPPSLRACP